jgi:arylsulfatase A-like enzyme
MLKKYTIPALGILTVAAIFFLSWRYIFSPSVRRANNYNIVLISIDTTRADFFGCYGNPVVSTPNVDRLASQGVLFENFYSTINTTLAAHSAIFTGLYPRDIGVGRNSMRLNPKLLTMAEFLHAKGYKTAGFIGSFALASVFGINQGFQTYDESFIGDPSSYIERQVESSTKGNNSFDIIIPKTNVGHIMRSAEEVNASFFKWLDHQKDDKFFAFVHYYDPHFPYDPPQQWYKRHLQTIPPGTPLVQDNREEVENQFKQLIDPEIQFTAAKIDSVHYSPEINALLQLYRSEIEYTDNAVGQVVERLKKNGLISKTIIIVTADHGENLVEHWNFNSFFRHGFLTYETETHIPLIISCPGILPQNRRVPRVSSQIDIFPTVTDLVDIPPPKVDGISLLTLLFSDRNRVNRFIFSEASQPHINLQREAKNLVWVNDLNSGSVRKDQYKYTMIPYRQFEALYDIQDDPLELKNALNRVSLADPKLPITLRDELEKWRKTAKSGNIDTSFQLSDEDREKLESLGYVQ